MTKKTKGKRTTYVNCRQCGFLHEENWACDGTRKFDRAVLDTMHGVDGWQMPPLVQGPEKPPASTRRTDKVGT